MGAEVVNRPNHYARFEIEPIEFIMRNRLEFWQGNVIKYVMRYDAKDGIQDLRKAARYLDMQIKKLEGNDEFAKLTSTKVDMDIQAAASDMRADFNLQTVQQKVGWR